MADREQPTVWRRAILAARRWTRELPGILSPILTLALAATAYADMPPLRLIPADALLCWSSARLPDAPTSAPADNAVSTLLDVGTRLVGAKLDRSTQITIRIFEAFSSSIRFPLAVALLDLQARPAELNPQARKLAYFQVVAAVQAGAESDRLRRVIQKVINEQTDAKFARLENRTAERWQYQELHDVRKEDLGAVAWGQIDDCFVITLGEGVWARVAAAAAGKADSLAADAWVQGVRARHPEQPEIELYGAPPRLARRLDPMVQGRAGQFFASWGLGEVQRGWWSLGFEGRALYSRATFEERNGFNRERLYADPHAADPALLAVVPPDARYAIYSFPAGLFVQRACAAWFALFDAQERAWAEKHWQAALAKAKVDPQKDILDQLGARFVLHNYPPHPLRLPMTFTTLIEISGDAKRLRSSMDALLEAWVTETEADSGERSSFDLFHLRHDSDGVWYVELGPVAGVAWTTTERFVVASWSPQALRAYLAETAGKLGKK